MTTNVTIALFVFHLGIGHVFADTMVLSDRTKGVETKTWHVALKWFGWPIYTVTTFALLLLGLAILPFSGRRP